jgi:hypothetical protein
MLDWKLTIYRYTCIRFSFYDATHARRKGCSKLELLAFESMDEAS